MDKKLTDEEKRVLKRVAAEATCYRGVPVGLAVTWLCDVALRARHEMGNVRRFGHPYTPALPLSVRYFHALNSMLIGLTLGQLTYANEARRRIVNELPRDSLLRKKVEKLSDKLATSPPESVASASDRKKKEEEDDKKDVGK